MMCLPRADVHTCIANQTEVLDEKGIGMPDVIRWRPSPKVRKTLLLVHIASAGAWLGFDLVLGILTVTALRADASSAAAAAVSLAAFTTWPLVATGLLALTSGILLGIGSKYGLVRYRWVLIKLLLTIALIALVPVLLMSGVTTLHENGLRAMETGSAPVVEWNALFPPIVSSTSLVFAMTLSVFKPWGRTRRLSRMKSMSGSESRSRMNDQLR